LERGKRAQGGVFGRFKVGPEVLHQVVPKRGWPGHVKRKREDALLARVLEGGVRKREREWMVSVVRSRIL
jgi:hypothetical protein